MTNQLGKLRTAALGIADYLAGGGNATDAETLRSLCDHAKAVVHRQTLIIQDLRSQVAIGTKTIKQLRDRLRIAESDLADTRAARALEIPRATRLRMVRCAYEHGEVSGGEAAELLEEPIQAFLGRRWKVRDDASRIKELEEQVQHLREGLKAIMHYGDREDAAAAKSITGARRIV